MKKILLSLLLLLLFTPLLVKADGGFMPSPDSWVYETNQKAAIYYFNNQETLVLQASFLGEAKDFAWIIPTPSQPEVSKISSDFFYNLEKLTSQDEFVYPMAANKIGLETQSQDEGVTVLEEKQVGIYETKILSATNKDALYNWLKENNFTYPESKKYILDDYITNKWFFTTAKISAEAITPDVETKVRQGELTPLKLVFSSDKIVYPLKISALSQYYQQLIESGYTNPVTGESIELSKEKYTTMLPYDYMNIDLYIFANHKKEINNFNVNYANWIKSDDINKLAKDDNGNSWVKADKKMFLTKLYYYMPFSEMTDDLFPDNSKKNDLVGVETWWDKFITWGERGWFSVIFIIGSILFILLAMFQSKLEQRKMILWYLQLFSWLAIGFMLFMIYFVTSNISYLYSNYSVGFFRDNLYLVNSFVTNLFVYLFINICLVSVLIKQKPKKS